MSKIPCKKCKSCGFYHDLSVTTCDECGTDLQKTPAFLIETEDIPGEKYGEIDEDVTVFVQKCSACGALNFTADKNSPVKVCHNCHKTRVASIEPVEYIEPSDNVRTDDDSIEDDDASADETVVQAGGSAGTAGNAKVLFDDDDDDNDDDSVQWQGILGNIRKTVGSPDPSPIRKAETPHKTNNTPPPLENDDNDDDDDDVSDWSGILGGKPAPQKAVAASYSPAITLTAIRYGRLSFTIEAKPNQEYMLGRSANQSDFLCSDGRVGNEHCFLYFKIGSWYVKDNHSANGTAVNSRDLGLNGESRLNDGDELKLGHHSDSMAFRITIK